MKPRIEEFELFIDFLLADAPKSYVPWLFRCQPQGKPPALEFGSWKDKKNRLTVAEAVEWMKHGGNIGIAAMPDDPLINIDIDDENITKKDELKPTLMARTRSRRGLHAWYFSNDDIPNIPTDNAGEIRAKAQYVIAPGSYVKTDPSEVPLTERENAGYYTLLEKKPVAWITYAELPEIFRKIYEKTKQQEARQPTEFNPKIALGRHSALFDITARDVVLREGGDTNPSKRWGALFHDSTTDANMSLSTKGLLHCWRHNVSHNGLQALVVLSGYMTCQEAGSPHKGSGAGPSLVNGDDGAIFYAWKYAKEHGYIPIDDPIPIRAMNYIAKKHGVYVPKNGEMLPKWAYNRVLKIVEEEY